MAKIKHSAATRKRKKKVLKQAKGFFQDRSKQFRQARRALLHAMAYAYRDRRNKKRVIRRLWIVRVNAACRQHGITYSRFMAGLKKAEVKIDRKMLADLAVRDTRVFEKLVALIKS